MNEQDFLKIDKYNEIVNREFQDLMNLRIKYEISDSELPFEQWKEQYIKGEQNA